MSDQDTHSHSLSSLSTTPGPQRPPREPRESDSDHNSNNTTKRLRLHSPSSDSDLQQLNHPDDLLESESNTEFYHDTNSDPEPQSDIESSNVDDLVLSEVHIHPANGRVDGQTRTSIFHVGSRSLIQIETSIDAPKVTKDLPWDYAVEIQHAMGTTLRGVGSQVWMGCFLLVDWMISIREQLTGNVALELGGGTGLASIAVCLATPVEKVFCTDYDVTVLSNCERNIALNHHLQDSKSQDTLVLNKRIFPRRYNWLFDDPMDSVSSSQEKFDWNALEIEEWKNKGAFIFAADVVYDDSLTDALITCLEKLLVVPLPKDHQFHKRGRVAYVTMEKRFNFSLDQLSVVAQAFDYFVKKMAESTLIEAHRVDCSQLAQHCDYERSKDLELFSVVLRNP
ncbi:Methyltransferase-like protein 22 [Entomortierella chlamydospora]|nr:Methyltransferase-like protein 22 [Entomortierella chlamydospora]